MKKILLLLFLFVFIEKINAYYFYYDEEKVEDMYITRSDGNVTKSSNPYILKRKDDNQYVYCIEPLTPLNDTDNYDSYDYNAPILNISDETLKRINLIAHYGYNYKNHTDIKWYGITQYLIWKESNPNYNIFFAAERYGNMTNKYDKEITEIMALVNKDLVGLNIKDEYYITINEKYSLVINDLLENYEIIDNRDLNIEIVNNELIVEAKKSGIYELELKRKKDKNDLKFYYNNISQNLFLNGNIKGNIKVKINVKTANIYLTKKDVINTLNNNITLENATYGLFDKNNNLIEEVKTDFNGKITFSNLKLDNYKIKEISPSYGFMLDLKEYDIDLKEDVELIVYENRINKKITLHKVYHNKDLYLDEANTEFEIYKDDILIKKITTNNLGIAETYLEYGKYKIVQANGIIGYCYSEDIIINIDSNYEENIIEIINEPIIEKELVEKKVLGKKIKNETLIVKNTKKNRNYNIFIILILCIIGKYVIKN